MIENKALRENEKKWLEIILSPEFSCKKKLIEQINCAKIIREYTDYYISLQFEVDDRVSRICTKVRVPIELHVFRAGSAPTLFLLHAINGYVSELEIFNGDSSKIDEEGILKYARMEIVLSNEDV